MERYIDGELFYIRRSEVKKTIRRLSNLGRGNYGVETLDVDEDTLNYIIYNVEVYQKVRAKAEQFAIDVEFSIVITPDEYDGYELMIFTDGDDLDLELLMIETLNVFYDY